MIYNSKVTGKHGCGIFDYRKPQKPPDLFYRQLKATTAECNNRNKQVRMGKSTKPTYGKRAAAHM
jgi:hypothetical protein